MYTSCWIPTDTAEIQEHLIQQYKEATNSVQVMPLNDKEGLPLPQIYGPVLIEEDLTTLKKTRRSDEPSGRRPLDNYKDLFYVNDKLVRRIIVHGEAGHGKTVFCLKVIESWSQAKMSCRDEEELLDTIGVDTHIQEGARIEGSERGNCSSSESKNDNLLQTPLSNIDHKLNDMKSKMYMMPNSFIPIVSNFDKYDDFPSVTGMDEGKELQSCLSKFDLVFYIPLRHAKHGTSSIVDLVCDSVPECDEGMERKIKQMLRDKNIPCLVILDGLDEWRTPDTCRVRGFPDDDGLVNCSLLCTMRSWRMVNLQLALNGSRDKVVQILGLKERSVAKVISNILINFYGLKSTSPLYKQMLEKFCNNAKLQGLEKIPLMLAASCLVWYEEDEECSSSSETYQGTSDFITLLYVKLLKIMISRAAKKHDVITSCKKRQIESTPKNKPQILSKFRDILIFMEVLIPVARLALHDLVSEEMHLVFAKDEIEDDIGEWKIELALKAGVLSQAEAPGKPYEERVSVSFFHKSFHEFMAALYIVCGDAEAFESFCVHCNTVEKNMELSNMILFVFGLNPAVGCQMSEHVKDVVNNDADIIQYREQSAVYTEGNMKIEALYKIQCKWYSEMKQNLSYTHNTDQSPTLHVTDVYLDYSHGDVSADDVNVEDVTEASELVSMEDNSIVSVYLHNVPHPVHSIIHHLPVCKHLTTLNIRDNTDRRDKELLAVVLPLLIHLQYLVYGYDVVFRRRLHTTGYASDYPGSPVDTAIVRAVQHLPAMKHIELWGITLTDTVTLPPQLQFVELYVVNPAHFILSSSPGCPHLTSLDISCCCLTMKDCEVLASVLPQLKHLQFICYNGSESACGPAGHAAVVSTLQHLTQLTHIRLSNIDLGDVGTLLVTPHMTQLQEVTLASVEMSARRWTKFFSSLQHATQLTHIELEDIYLGNAGTLLVTPNMRQLQKVRLYDVRMSARRWTEFVESFLTVQHTVYVTLKKTNIDDDTVKTIHSSQHFAVTKEERNYWDKCVDDFEFHLVQ